MFRRILMPVDVTSPDLPSLADAVLRTVREQLAGKETTLEAVYVLTPGAAGVAPEELLQKMEFYRGLGLARLAERFSGPGEWGPAHFTVLPVLGDSLQAAADALLAHGEKTHGELIALPTHARGGVDRFFLGSFTESLLLSSRIPLLTLNPRARERRDRHYLFCTDLEGPSRQCLDRVLDLACRKEGRVTVLHLVKPTPTLSAVTGYLGEAALEGCLAEAGARLERFCRGLDRRGVALGQEVDVAVEGVAQSVTQWAERLGASLIVMGSAVRGRALIPALGAVSRQVIRRAPVPVLTMPGGSP